MKDNIREFTYLILKEAGYRQAGIWYYNKEIHDLIKIENIEFMISH